MKKRKTNKVQLLAAALNRANEAAKKADPVEDNGTCNMDSPIIILPHWKEKEVQEASELSGVELSDKLHGWFSGYRFVRTAAYGQAQRRTTMVEAAKKSLESDGYNVSVWYHMD